MELNTNNTDTCPLKKTLPLQPGHVYWVYPCGDLGNDQHCCWDFNNNKDNGISADSDIGKIFSKTGREIKVLFVP